MDRRPKTRLKLTAAACDHSKYTHMEPAAVRCSVVMGSGSKSRVRVGYHFPGSGQVRVPKMSGFPWGFGYPNTSLLMGSGSKSRVQVEYGYHFSGSCRVPKKSGFPPGFGFSGTRTHH